MVLIALFLGATLGFFACSLLAINEKQWSKEEEEFIDNIGDEY